MIIIHKIASWFLSRRIQRIEYCTGQPLETQNYVLMDLLTRARHTEWGRTYGYADIQDEESFRNRVPISTYEELYPFIERTLQGEKDVLWRGQTEWFAKSSGTTNDRSKYIPVTEESLEETHYKAGQDMLAAYFEQRPESKLLSGKSLTISGNYVVQDQGIGRAGDLSSVLFENLPLFYSLRRAPSKRLAMLSEWEDKIDAIAREVAEEDITAIAGVPTWLLIMFDRIFEHKQISDRNLLHIWPNLEYFSHGGVNFEPYREQFNRLIPSSQMNYMNVYNASEGFFGIQDDLSKDDMLLLLDYGIYYEFIPIKHIHDEQPLTLGLDDVQVGKDYAMVISTNGGLWRYMIGDTICFTEIYPFRFRISGRTKHFINAFGEELMVDNAETALVKACEATGAAIDNYTAAPIYFGDASRGGHEWLIEFIQAPHDMGRFTEVLDEELKALNSDYGAKRHKDMALSIPTLRSLPRGTFYAWMKKRGKLGGQNKVPRLYNDRKYVEDILEMMGI